jgi:hypothetical protein
VEAAMSEPVEIVNYFGVFIAVPVEYTWDN